MKTNKKELTVTKKEEIRRNIIYNNDGDFSSTLTTGQYRYRVSSPKKTFNYSEAGNFCQKQNSKLVEIKTEFDHDVIKFLLLETEGSKLIETFVFSNSFAFNLLNNQVNRNN